MILDRARSQRVYITLLGPRNETLTGQLNMTDFQSMGRTGHQNALAAKDDDIKHYDSRGAAYYICVFILVYALAIVMFVASLAKRRRFEQNGDFSRLPKSDILHYYSSEGTAGTAAAAGPLRGEAVGAAADQKRSSKDATESGIHVGGGSGGQDIWSAAAGRKEAPAQVGSRRRGDATASTPDELITLVQVLPCGEGGGDDGDEPRLDNYYWTEGRGSDAAAAAAAAAVYPPEPDQKCRWSIGPDGNLFILQVDETDSCTNFRLDDDNCETRIIADRKPPPPPPDARQKHEMHGRRHTNGQHCVASVVDGDPAAAAAAKTRSISHDNLTSCEPRIVVSSRSPPVEKCTASSRGGGAMISAMAKCNSASFFQQDTVALAGADNNNYNFDFGNPWGQSNYYPEIQKLLHVTSV